MSVLTWPFATTPTLAAILPAEPPQKFTSPLHALIVLCRQRIHQCHTEIRRVREVLMKGVL